MDAEGGCAGEGGVFRVRVSLERYFSDERARCYMAARSARSVRWLARRLRAAFRLRGRFVLLAAGHLLPPAEPLALLRPDDLVHVVPTKWTELAASESDEAGECPASPPRASEPLTEDEPDVAPPPLTPDAELEESKRRALSLLDELGPPAPRRRRRVRRRRRAPSPAPSPTPPLEEETRAPSPRDIAPRAPEADPDTERPPSVVRVGGGEARAPRVVRPLHVPSGGTPAPV